VTGRPSPDTPAIEWAAAAVGGGLLAAMVGFMLWAGVREGSDAPRLVVRVEAIAPAEHGWRVDFVVENRGGSTAAGVRLSGLLTGDGAAPERSTAVLDYVPQRSERRGALHFTADPAAGALALRIESHVEP
jgi:uncharacterized protein (TIGR02588 family)